MRSRIATIAVVIAFIVLGLSVDGLGQGNHKIQRRPYTPKAVRLNKKLPTIFLVLDRIFTSKEGNEKRVLFRLRNNAVWAVEIDASGGRKGEDDAKLYYETVDKKGGVIESHLCHVCSTIALRPGETILFSIPYDEIVEANALRIGFGYQWEDQLLVAPQREPTHYVYFYSREVKEAAKPGKIH